MNFNLVRTVFAVVSEFEEYKTNFRTVIFFGTFLTNRVTLNNIYQIILARVEK